jgi:hypothetical protein
VKKLLALFVCLWCSFISDFNCGVCHKTEQEDAEFTWVVDCNQLHFIEVDKPKKKKKKGSVSIAFKVCIKAFEETFKEILNKEITHILKELPKWIDRLGSRGIIFEDDESMMSPNAILSVIQFIKDNCVVNQYFEKTGSHLNNIWHHGSNEEKINCLIAILAFEKESFFDELFHVLSASLRPEQRKEIEEHYDSLLRHDDGHEQRADDEESEIDRHVDNEKEENPNEN